MADPADPESRERCCYVHTPLGTSRHLIGQTPNDVTKPAARFSGFMQVVIPQSINGAGVKRIARQVRGIDDLSMVLLAS